MHRARSFKPALLAVPLLFIALLSGCVSSEPQPDPPASASAHAPSSSTLQAQESGPQQLGDLGTRPSGKEKVEVTLNNVVANEGTMTVNFTMANNEESGNIQVKDRFSNGLRDAEESAGTADTFSADGVYVVTSEKKRYLVGRDDRGVCACSGNLSNMFVNSGGSMTFSAVFAAPPQEIGTVDVFIPTVGTFADVPLERR